MSRVAKSNDYGLAEKNFSIYFSGFLLCVILTLVPFYAVIHNITTRQSLIAIIFASAIVQFFVQVICFLRLKGNSRQGQITILSFISTGIVTFVVIAGSIWIMTNLDYFMMN